MRLFFGSDIIGNQKIFPITVTATDCTYTGDSTIGVGLTASLLFTADAGYELPSVITVSGATAAWDKDTGVLLLSAVTGAVTVEVVAEEIIIIGSPIYGVSGLYQSDPALTRTDDSVGKSYTISNGVVSSDFDSVFPWNEATVETIDGNKFLHLPAMWFRVGTDANGRITDVAVSKSQGDSGTWYQTREFYYACYGASLDENNKLCSASGEARANLKTRAEFRSYASANGASYHQLDLYTHTIMMFLWWIEWAKKDSQSVMNGADLSGTGGYAQVTGGTDSLTSPSGFDTTTNQMRWHYIEDFVGNMEEFVDGIVGSGTLGGKMYVTDDPTKYSDSSTGLNELPWNAYYNSLVDYTRWCISSYGWDSNNPFLIMPKDCVNNNSYNTYFCDRNSRPNNDVCLLVGSNYYAGLHDFYGLSFCIGVSETFTQYYMGARLIMEATV